MFMSPVRLFWRSSLPEPWFDGRNSVRLDEMMKTQMRCNGNPEKISGVNDRLTFLYDEEAV